MNTKCLISTSIIALFTASVAQAADITIPRESRPVVSPPQTSGQISPPVEMSSNSNVPPVISAPTFSWNGFYLGGQIGGFSGKTGISLYAKKGPGTREWTAVEKDTLPQLSGFMGGLYAGANVDLGNSLILGVDTDIVWSNKQDTKIVSKKTFEVLSLEGIEEEEQVQERVERDVIPRETDALSTQSAQIEQRERVRRSSVSSHNEEFTSQQQMLTISRSTRDGRETEEFTQIAEIVKTCSYTLKQQWSGATRIRIGFAVDRIMPYVAGGIAYTQLQSIFSRSLEMEHRKENLSDLLDKKMMVGYTVGGGIDFAMADNVILRAEYRYSDFGKQKFFKDKLELSYQTNDFRVGVAYKF
ncbi:MULTISPECIES: porin [Bartonella]|uniref:Porin n=1 Tax=Bartonella chomelii TaxID=236402 RepID=A0ABR6E130_9HYPH|nr:MULTISPECIES: porin [Bartonella]MBA9082267.1 outer membrane immunogenic protein [Bartonella chomelii]